MQRARSVRSADQRAGVKEPRSRTRRWKGLMPRPAVATGSPICCTHDASNVHQRRYAYSPSLWSLDRGSQTTATTPEITSWRVREFLLRCTGR